MSALQIFYGLLFCFLASWSIWTSFFPWLRQGLGSTRTSTKTPGSDRNPTSRSTAGKFKSQKQAAPSYDTHASADLQVNFEPITLTKTVANNDSTANESIDISSVDINQLFNNIEIVDASADAFEEKKVTDLRGQLAGLRQEKSQAVSANQRANNTVEPPKFYREQRLPNVPLGKDGEPDLCAHIFTLEKQLEEGNDYTALLSDELEKARTFEYRFQELDKKLAESQTLLLQKEDELVEFHKRNAMLGDTIRELRYQIKDHQSELHKYEDQNLQLQRLPSLEAKLLHQEMKLKESDLQADKFNELESRLYQKENKSRLLQTKLDELAELQSPSSAIREKDSEIAELKLALEKAKTELDQLGHTATAMQKLEQELNAKKAAFARLEQQLYQSPGARTGHTAQGSDIEQANSSKNRPTDLADQLNAALARRDEALAREDKLSVLLAERANEIARLRDYEHTTTALHQKINEQDQQIAKREQQITDLKHRLRETTSTPTITKHSNPQVIAPTRLFQLSSEKDDLKKIKGIGPVMEKTLNSLGITSYKQICELTRDDVNKVSAAIATFPNRIERDDWIGGAKKQYMEKYGKSEQLQP